MRDSQENSIKAFYRRLLLPGILIVSAFLVYAGALSGDFVYDDRIEILNNPTIRKVSNIPSAFRRPFWSFAQLESDENISNYYRPLKTIVYILGVRLWGFNPFWFHLLSVLLHGLAGVLVFSIALKFMDKEIYPALAAFVFIVHPAQTEAVAWISSICDPMSALLYLAAIYLYISRERFKTSAIPLSLSVICFLAALFSKETALSLPLILVAIQITFRSPRKWATRAAHLSPYALALAVYMFLRVSALSGFSPTMRLEHLSEIQIWMSVVHLFAKYIAMLFYPAGLSAHHVFYPITGFADWRFLLSAATLAAYLIAALGAYKKFPAFFLYLSWTLLALLPMFYIRAIGENVFCDRYLYMPIIGFAMLGSHALMLMMGSLKSRPRKAFAAAAAGFILVFYAILAVDRIPVWNNNLVFFRETLKTAPEVRWISRDYCTAFYELEKADKALKCFESYAAKYPEDTNINFNLGGVYATKAHEELEKGRPEEALKLFERAQDKIEKSYQGTRRDADIFYNLAIIQIEKSKIMKSKGEYISAENLTRNAAGLLIKCRQLDPEYFMAYIKLAELMIDRSREMKKTAHFNVEKDQINAIIKEADNFAKAAAAELEQAIKLFPRNIEALNMLGKAYTESGQLEKAERAYIQALKYRENNELILLNLGVLYLEYMGRPDKAYDTFSKILEIHPGHPGATIYLQKIKR